MNSFKSTMLLLLGFIGYARSDNLCVSDSSILSGEYIESATLFNGKPTYELDLTNCNSDSAHFFYNANRAAWYLVPDTVGSTTYYAKCSIDSASPQDCPSWEGAMTIGGIISGNCPRTCTNSNTLEITQSGNSNCRGTFSRLEGQSGDVFYRNNNGVNYYWSWNPHLNYWICDNDDFNHGCSVDSAWQFELNHGGILDIGYCHLPEVTAHPTAPTVQVTPMPTPPTTPLPTTPAPTTPAPTTPHPTIPASNYLCISGASSLSGEYMKSSQAYNNHPVYTLELHENCGYDSAHFYYNNNERWQLAPDAAGTNSYFAICNDFGAPTPFDCTSWSGSLQSMIISDGECTKACEETNILTFTGGRTSRCNGDFVRVSGQNGDVFSKEYTDGITYYWSWNSHINYWICDAEYNHGCSVSSAWDLTYTYDSIYNLAECKSLTTTPAPTPAPILITMLTPSPTMDEPVPAPDNTLSICTGSAVFEGAPMPINEIWDMEYNNDKINNKQYYTLTNEFGDYYLYYMSGCGLFNYWIIDDNTNNGDDSLICSSSCSSSSISCSTHSFNARCREEDIVNCIGNGKWEFPDQNGSFVADPAVAFNAAMSCIL